MIKRQSRSVRSINGIDLHRTCNDLAGTRITPGDQVLQRK